VEIGGFIEIVADRVPIISHVGHERPLEVGLESSLSFGVAVESTAARSAIY
jgi:hypothetical protein